MNKKYIFLPLLLLVVLISTMAVTPKPGPMAILTLVNKMVNQPGVVSLKGLTNFYNYNLTSRAYKVDVLSADGPVGKSKDDSPRNLKTEVTTYQVRQDWYEATISACGFIIEGMVDLRSNSQIVFPACEHGLYGKQYIVLPRSPCIKNPTLPFCRKEGFVLTYKGGRGESKNIKVRQPPVSVTQ
ncbi:MAG: hypothetical protein WCI88_01860 [Chloroflexota bacterium]|jgi:hypothetical protein